MRDPSKRSADPIHRMRRDSVPSKRTARCADNLTPERRLQRSKPESPMMHRLTTLCFGLFASLLWAGSSLAAEPMTSRYTSLTGSECRLAPRQSSEDEGDEEVKRCPGLGGFEAVLFLDHAQTALTLAPRAARGEPETVRAWSVGERIEWRGWPPRGAFRPDAAIVRLKMNREGSPVAARQILAVLRVEERRACLVSLIDMTANPNPYDLARETADRSAADHRCGRDKPRAFGLPTSWTERVLEMNR